MAPGGPALAQLSSGRGAGSAAHSVAPLRSPPACPRGSGASDHQRPRWQHPSHLPVSPPLPGHPIFPSPRVPARWACEGQRGDLVAFPASLSLGLSWGTLRAPSWGRGREARGGSSAVRHRQLVFWNNRELTRSAGRTQDQRPQVGSPRAREAPPASPASGGCGVRAAGSPRLTDRSAQCLLRLPAPFLSTPRCVSPPATRSTPVRSPSFTAPLGPEPRCADRSDLTPW